MSLRVILRILGLLLMLFSLTMLPPTLISLWFRDGVWSAFISGIAISVVTGLLLYLPNRRDVLDGAGAIWLAAANAVWRRLTEYHRCGI